MALRADDEHSRSSDKPRRTSRRVSARRLLFAFERELANFHLAFEIEFQLRAAGDGDVTLCRKTALAGDGEDAAVDRDRAGEGVCAGERPFSVPLFVIAVVAFPARSCGSVMVAANSPLPVVLPVSAMVLFAP